MRRSIPIVQGNVGTVTLQASSILLAEAVVTADRKINKMRNGNIVTDIANSSLKGIQGNGYP